MSPPRKWNIFHSLRSKMLLWAVVFVVPILAILYGTIWNAAESYEDQMLRNIDQMLNPYSTDIDAALSSAKLYVANLKVDPADFIGAEETPESLQRQAILSADLAGDLALYPQIDATFLYRGGEIRFVQNYGRPYPKSYAAAQALCASLGMLGEDAQLFQQGYLYFETEDGFFLYIAMNVHEGVVGCWFSVDSLFEAVRAAGLPGLFQIMLADREGRLLNAEFDTRSARLLSQKLAPYLVTRAMLASAPFEITVLWDESIVLAPVARMYEGMFAAISFACLLFVLYILFLRVSLVKPLSRLANAVGSFTGGNFAPLHIHKNDGAEIENVYRALNAMIEKIETLQIQMYEEKLTKQQTQMQLFQLQIRPHFLLNALNTIVSFARIRNYDMVQKMTMYLATHCRYILYNSWYVSLEEELVYTQNFIDMQSTQHEDRYRYIVRVEDALLDDEIPILAIQIFVENALKHAQDIDRQMEILVGIDALQLAGGRYLRICIQDNGKGFSDALLAELNGQKSYPPEKWPWDRHCQHTPTPEHTLQRPRLGAVLQPPGRRRLR